MKGPSINEAIRDHATEADWQYRDMQRLCHHVFTRANARFFDFLLTTPVLEFETINCKVAGRYLAGHSSIGTRSGIVLNPQHFNRRLIEVMSILVHDMVHQWEDLLKAQKQQKTSRKPQNLAKNGPPKPDRHYHGLRFVGKCEEIGIPAKTGYTCVRGTYTPIFASFLREEGIDPEASAVRDVDAPKAIMKYARKTWRCGCAGEEGIILAGEKHSSTCHLCGQDYQRSSYRKSA